ncbi:MAG: hypothetical protein R6X15_07290 [Pseudomonadota bacterium]
MNLQTMIAGKPLGIEMSARAAEEIARRETPLPAEMELYFSCLVRKKVRFYEDTDHRPQDSVQVDEHRNVRFRPVMTQSCSVSEVEGDEPPVTDFPITNPAAFVPHWLQIDYRDRRWQGEFGYRR